MFEIEFYRTKAGEVPVEQFLDSITDLKMKRKTLQTIQLLKEYGNRLRMPFSKAVRDGIFELRIQLAGNISRVLYFFNSGNIIILTNGFVKKTQKLPVKEVELALRYKKDYENRKERQNGRL